MLKKIIAAILACITATMLFAGCSNNTPAQPAPAANESGTSSPIQTESTPSEEPVFPTGNLSNGEDSAADAPLNGLNSINITHLDDFEKYGFTFETGEYGTSIRAYQYALVSDAVKIYVGDGAFSYEINLLDGNLRDVHQSDVHIPDMEGSNKTLDVGYGIKLTSDQMKYMGFVAKCFYENPSAPFSHLIPKEIADAAAQNDVFIDVKYANDWRLVFISLRYSYVHTTYGDGSQTILPNGLSITSESFLANGVDFNHPAYNIVKQSIESPDETDDTFNPDTLEWTFNDEVTSGLIELMQSLNTQYEN